MNISDIPEKHIGQKVQAAEFNTITGSFPLFQTYSDFKDAAEERGYTPDVWYALVMNDEKNNEGKATLYIYALGKLNWVAVTPVTL